jgi:hypothetical protein
MFEIRGIYASTRARVCRDGRGCPAGVSPRAWACVANAPRVGWTALVLGEDAMILEKRALRALLLLLALGCGSSGSASRGAPPSPGPDGSVQDADDGFGAADAPLVTVDASGPADAGCPAMTPRCPAGSAPAQGEPCETPSGFNCEYGDDPQSRCNIVAWCRDPGGWVVEGALVNSGCPTLPPSCPASASAARSSPTACSADGFECIYPEATCVCDRNGRGPTLECSAAPSPDCPATRPRYGTPCGGDAGTCMQWGDGCGGLAVETAVCTCGTWQRLVCMPL